MKHLRRRVIMRQYDYIKHLKNFVPVFYDSSDFEPITLEELKKEHMFLLLKNSASLSKLDQIDYEYPRNYLAAMSDWLYNRDYVNWFSEYDEDGYLWIQARSNTPSSILGWATFESDY